MTTYTVGTRRRLIGTFRDEDGALADPSTVTCKVKTPSGAETTYTGGQVASDSTGVWSTEVTLSEPGTWWYRFEGTGAVTVTGESPLQVQQSSF